MQRDYILRLIEQLGPISGALIRSAELRKGHQYRAAGETVAQTLRQHFGLGMEVARRRSAEELIGAVRLGWSVYAGREVNVGKLVLLGALLREQADIDAAQGDEDEATSGRIKALEIFLTVLIEEDAAAGDAAEEIGPLVDQLAGYELPPQVQDLLWRYYEQAGAFDQAENWLFRLLESEPTALERALAFYERLGSLGDDELAAGGLPREEVAAGLAELRARRGGS